MDPIEVIRERARVEIARIPHLYGTSASKLFGKDVPDLCDEMERLQRMWHEEHDERVGLETRLNRANTEIAYWQQEARAAREGEVKDAG